MEKEKIDLYEIENCFLFNVRLLRTECDCFPSLSHGVTSLGGGGELDHTSLKSFNNRRLKSQLQRCKDPQEEGWWGSAV